MDFAEANKQVHPVEDQWHYQTLIDAGFVAETKSAVGFVRSYTYYKGEHQIKCNTGASSDYWTDLKTNKGGYWSDLAPHLAKLQKEA
jgi:hypothetical protein